MISMAPFPWERGNWECGRSAIHPLGGLTDEQQNQVEDIVRLIPAEERAAFRDAGTRVARSRTYCWRAAPRRGTHMAHIPSAPLANPRSRRCGLMEAASISV